MLYIPDQQAVGDLHRWEKKTLRILGIKKSGPKKKGELLPRYAC